MGNVKEFEVKSERLKNQKSELKRIISDFEKKLDNAQADLEKFENENKQLIKGVFSRVFNGRKRETALFQVRKKEKNIEKIENELKNIREELRKVDIRCKLLENYHSKGDNAYVKRFISSLDERLKERQFARGDHNTYADLWEEARWLNEINHPKADKYEAIACWCSYKEFRAPKEEKERAFKRALELHTSCDIAKGYCKSYYVYQEPTSSNTNKDPMGYGDGVPVDGTGM